MSEERRKLVSRLRSLDQNSLAGFDSGPLSDGDIAKGMHLSFLNANDLFEDAALLYTNERFGRSLSLLVLALEELGRIPLLMNGMLINAADGVLWTAFWKQLRQHKTKQGVWTAYGIELARTGHPDAPLFVPALTVGDEKVLDRLKQCGFYVSYFDEQFLLPNLIGRYRKKRTEELFAFVEKRILAFSKLHSNLGGSLRFVVSCRLLLDHYSKEQLKSQAEEVFTRKSDVR